MDSRSTIKKGLIRLVITLFISLVLVWVGSEVAFYFLKENTDRVPEQIELVIPVGTADKVAAGEPIPSIPDEMTFVLGDTLIVKNEDTVDHQLGPLWIPPRSKASMVLDAAERYAYSCSFQTSRYLGLNVKQATTWLPTPKLNKAFEIIKAERTGATNRGKLGWPKIYYATQIAINPVTILMFVNRPELFEENYRRYIMGRLKSLLPVAEVPIRLLARSHKSNNTF